MFQLGLEIYALIVLVCFIFILAIFMFNKSPVNSRVSRSILNMFMVLYLLFIAITFHMVLFAMAKVGKQSIYSLSSLDVVAALAASIIPFVNILALVFSFGYLRSN